MYRRSRIDGRQEKTEKAYGWQAASGLFPFWHTGGIPFMDSGCRTVSKKYEKIEEKIVQLCVR